MADVIDSMIWAIRTYVYRRFADTAGAPTVQEVAAEFCLSAEDAAAAFRELDRRHAFFLDPGTLNVRIANPFSAVRTGFVVRARGRSYYANCAWDALGIPVVLHADADISATCAESGEPLPLRVVAGEAAPTAPVAHFLVPFRHWYDDMVFT